MTDDHKWVVIASNDVANMRSIRSTQPKPASLFYLRVNTNPVDGNYPLVPLQVVDLLEGQSRTRCRAGHTAGACACAYGHRRHELNARKVQKGEAGFGEHQGRRSQQGVFEKDSLPRSAGF